MPTWRADYFDKARDQAPTRSVIIEAERRSDALDKARAEMRSSLVLEQELIRIDFNSSAARIFVLSDRIYRFRNVGFADIPKASISSTVCPNAGMFLTAIRSRF